MYLCATDLLLYITNYFSSRICLFFSSLACRNNATNLSYYTHFVSKGIKYFALIYTLRLKRHTVIVLNMAHDYGIHLRKNNVIIMNSNCSAEQLLFKNYIFAFLPLKIPCIRPWHKDIVSNMNMQTVMYHLFCNSHTLSRLYLLTEKWYNSNFL